MNTMSPKEYKEALELIQSNNEAACDILVAQLKELYEQAICSGRVLGTLIRIDLALPKGDPKFDEIKKACQDYEEAIAYPEIRFVVRQIDSETK